MGRQSIQSRLIAAVVISQLVLALALASFGVWYTRHRMISALDATLKARAMSVAALARYSEDDTSTSLIFDSSLVPKPFERKRPDLYQIRVVGQGVVAQSPEWPQNLRPPGTHSYWGFTFAGEPYRGVWLNDVPILDREKSGPQPSTRLSVIYAVPLAKLNEEVTEAAAYIAVAGLLILASTVCIAVFSIRRGLRPLQELATQAARVSTSNWEVPETTEQTVELVPLTRAMKTMLDGLKEAFAQQREFLGNAAHELKTPVAIVKSTMQLTLQKAKTKEEYRLGMEQSLEDLDRIEKLLQWMLRLARAEQWATGAIRRDLEIVSLAETCEQAVDRLMPMARSRNVEIRVSNNEDVQLRADPEDLQLIWSNLLANAIRYSPEGSWITVAITRVQAHRAAVTVSDFGPGIPDHEIPHVFDRFYRADPSRARDTGGFGLGLAISRALVQAYGGTITVCSNVGEGTSMIVELPVLTADPSLTTTPQ